jgi:hypothetical protein
MKTWDEVSKEMQSNGVPLSCLGYCKIAFDAGQASVDAASGYDAGVDACEPVITKLREALKPFANYACKPPCGCHNCQAKEALTESN